MTAAVATKSIRSQISRQRSTLSEQDASRLSQAVATRFADSMREQGISWEAWSGLRVCLYRPFSRELDPFTLEEALASHGARLHFPRVISRDEARMAMVEVPRDLADQWQAGIHSKIQEPPAQLPACDPASLDVLFVPGVVFGLRGERVGMGLGYYDRYLSQAPQALRVALAFDFQLVDELEQSQWDQPMDWIITEAREWKSPALAAKLGKVFRKK